MASSSLVETLTASGGVESAGFLNDIVAQLWPNICVAGAQIVKSTVEPILASTLPGPLSNLRFVKLDLGQVPIRFSNVDVHKSIPEGIKLDMDMEWESLCDIELDGAHVPKIGIEKACVKGRLSILLCPLTNVIPLIGAVQVSFINTPSLRLDFTDAANIADCFLIEKTVRNTVLGIIEGMAVLPNRFLVKLDAKNDYFKTYQPHHGVVRLTIEKAGGITAPEKKSGVSRLIAKVVKDVPDCYVKVKVGAEAEWRTSVQKNNHDPVWNETHDFLVADYEQGIAVDIQDDDLGSDDAIGTGYTTIKDVLLNGGTHELSLSHKGEATPARLTIHAQIHNFVPDAAALLSAQSSPPTHHAPICGLATILIASALGLQGQPDQLNPSVRITWGANQFATAAQTYTPGTDIFNPCFDQAFRIPLTPDMLAHSAPAAMQSFRIALLNKTTELGGVDVPFEHVLHAPGLVKEEDFPVGGGAAVRAKIMLQGLQRAE